MVAYSFQRRFIDPIVAGSKRQTIRAKGERRHATPGKVLQLYFGMRTKHCRKIIPDVGCTWVDRIRINFGWRSVILGPDGSPIFEGETELNAFAVLDGFTGWEDLAAFWKLHHPGIEFFDGIAIGWGDRPKAAK